MPPGERCRNPISPLEADSHTRTSRYQLQRYLVRGRRFSDEGSSIRLFLPRQLRALPSRRWSIPGGSVVCYPNAGINLSIWCWKTRPWLQRNPTRHHHQNLPHRTPLVLTTSPSLPSTLSQAILHATANALNALSAL